MLKIPREKPVLILIIATSFGEADWILPVLSCLKKHYPEWEIVTVFGSHETYQAVTEKSSLSTFFLKISSANVLQNQIGQLFQEIIDANQVKIILKDYNKDEWAPFKSQLASRCPRALLVNFPHSTYIYTNKNTDPVKITKTPNAWSIHDIFLLSSEHDIPEWSQNVEMEKIKICGYPRYDAWWKNELMQAEDFIRSREARIANRSDKIFFYISRGDHPHYLDRPDYEYIVKSICKQVFSIPGSLLLIKTHPRQNINDLQTLLKDYDPDRYIISNLHLIQQASLANVIISSWSSGILDSLAVNKPVIEFWRFNTQGNWRTKPDGGKTTIYRELGLAHPANTEKELKEAIASVLSKPEVFLKKQTEAFKNYCELESNASLKTVNCLLEELRKKEQQYIDKITTSEFRAIIDKQLVSGEKLIEQNFPEKALEYFDIMRTWYPYDPRVANNAGVARYLLGDIDSAMEIFQTILNIHPDHIATAINLVDLLLSQKLESEALNVILDFISLAQTKNAKKKIQKLAEIRPFSDANIKKIAAAMSSDVKLC